MEINHNQGPVQSNSLLEPVIQKAGDLTWHGPEGGPYTGIQNITVKISDNDIREYHIELKNVTDKGKAIDLINGQTKKMVTVAIMYGVGENKSVAFDSETNKYSKKKRDGERKEVTYATIPERKLLIEAKMKLYTELSKPNDHSEIKEKISAGDALQSEDLKKCGLDEQQLKALGEEVSVEKLHDGNVEAQLNKWSKKLESLRTAELINKKIRHGHLYSHVDQMLAQESFLEAIKSLDYLRNDGGEVPFDKYFAIYEKMNREELTLTAKDDTLAKAFLNYQGRDENSDWKEEMNGLKSLNNENTYAEGFIDYLLNKVEGE
ncbi:MAG: hypothetical protein VX777_10070 [Chlamydiota bacterium]|nr:hypothetical protein [Chlamydiota bacterium]